MLFMSMEWECLWCAATSGPILFIPQIIYDCGDLQWNDVIDGKTEEPRVKHAPVPLCSPQIPHGLTRARTQASAVRGQRLTAWAMTRCRRKNLEPPSLRISCKLVTIWLHFSCNIRKQCEVLPCRHVKLVDSFYWNLMGNDFRTFSFVTPVFLSFIVLSPSPPFSSCSFPFITMIKYEPCSVLEVFAMSCSSKSGLMMTALYTRKTINFAISRPYWERTLGPMWVQLNMHQRR
jgi:hypothetical protein